MDQIRISTAPDPDMEKAFNYICSLCGYPAIMDDKRKTLTSFLREYNGFNTIEELLDAYNALAAGRLEEKMDSFKSLTGLSASRILQAYARTKRKDQTKADPSGKTRISDDNKILVEQWSNRTVVYNEDLTQQERVYLMKHWIDEQKKNFKEHGREEWLTASSFVFLEKEGTLRVKDGMLQMWDGHTYQDLAPWTQVEDMAVRLRHRELNLLHGRTEVRGIVSPSVNGSLDECKNKIAVSLYFQKS